MPCLNSAKQCFKIKTDEIKQKKKVKENELKEKKQKHKQRNRWRNSCKVTDRSAAEPDILALEDLEISA
ncbi:hypothetical protein HUJ05_010705 [Dendroctonus ponderosae]|nr:hypothetical protein HUJ05_010705 [Dendroctonus ponderosae]